MDSSGTSEKPYKVKIKKNLKGTYTWEFQVSGHTLEFVDSGIRDVKSIVEKRIKEWREEDGQ